MFQFQVLHQDSATQARRGRMQTPHGSIETPVFMPVGTFGSVRTLDYEDLHDIGAQIILGNTYHLLLRPGEAVFRELGGYHGWSGWKKPLLTDSGGYQIFCLPRHREITAEGAVFRSYVNGDRFTLTPEKSIQMQNAIHSDIVMVLDWCVPSTSDHATTAEAMRLTHLWAERSYHEMQRVRSQCSGNEQALFAIVQGGVHLDLRKQSVEKLMQLPFEGFAIGGLAVGETRREREECTQCVTELLPKAKPRYLMGVGTPLDLIEAVYRGVDMFDCVIPTMYAQRGTVFTWTGKKTILSKRFQFSKEPLDSGCECKVCQRYSIAYLNHLMKCQEPTGWRLLAFHNQFFYQSLFNKLQNSIVNGEFLNLYKSLKEHFEVDSQTKIT